MDNKKEEIGYVMNPGKITGSDIPCMKINKRGDFENKSSLTHIGDLPGAPALPAVDSYGDGGIYASTIYGAQFKEVQKPTPYYERNIPVTVTVPWLAEEQEKTFLNNTKEKQFPPVKTYRDLELSPIPDQKYESYVPTIYEREKPIDFQSIVVNDRVDNRIDNSNGGVKKVEGFGKAIDRNINVIGLIVLILIIFLMYLSYK